MLVTWDESMADYDFGPSHPMAPVRTELTVRLARELGVFDLLNVRVHAAGAGAKFATGCHRYSSASAKSRIVSTGPPRRTSPPRMT